MTCHVSRNWRPTQCTADKPMPLGDKGRWQHADAVETDYDGDYSIELKCPHCGTVIRTEMPD